MDNFLKKSQKKSFFFYFSKTLSFFFKSEHYSIEFTRSSDRSEFAIDTISFVNFGFEFIKILLLILFKVNWILF